MKKIIDEIESLKKTCNGVQRKENLVKFVRLVARLTDTQDQQEQLVMVEDLEDKCYCKYWINTNTGQTCSTKHNRYDGAKEENSDKKYYITYNNIKNIWTYLQARLETQLEKLKAESEIYQKIDKILQIT